MFQLPPRLRSDERTTKAIRLRIFEMKENQNRKLDAGTRRGLVRWGVKQMVFLTILAAALFLSAGRLNWPVGWFFFGVVFLVQVLTAVIFIPDHSELLVERSQLGAGTKKPDVLLAVLMAYSTVFSAIMAGLDSRYGWSGVISWAVILAAAAVGTLRSMCVIEIEPAGEFITYGVGIPLMSMRFPEKARGRAPIT
jgi:hypothetical protein